MASGTMRVEVVTPSGLIVDETDAPGVTATGHLGEFEARPGHQPYLVRLRPGRLSIGKLNFAIGGGTAEVRANHVVILADSCEAASDIDAARAQEAFKRASDRLAGKGPDDEEFDPERAQAALERAQARLFISKN